MHQHPNGHGPLSRTCCEHRLRLICGQPPATTLDNTYGALFIGTVFGLMLYGMTILQTYRYFRLYPNDRPIIFWLVISILALETFQTIQAVDACNFFNPLSLLEGHWSLRFMVPTTGLLIIVCQSFYARRVWYVGPQCRYIVGVVACIILVLLGFTIATTVETFRLNLYDFQHISWLASVMVGLAAAADAILTVTLIAILLRRRTGFKHSDSTIEVIVVYTVNTGLLSWVFAIFTFIFAIVLPGNLIYVGFTIVSAKLYANCVLAVLNSRRSLSTRMLGGIEMSPALSRPARPHTQAEMWDVPQVPEQARLGEVNGTATHTISFVRPANLASTTSDFSGTGTISMNTGAEESGKPYRCGSTSYDAGR